MMVFRPGEYMYVYFVGLPGGMHSLWAGGATAAVRAGVAHHLFKRHGH